MKNTIIIILTIIFSLMKHGYAQCGIETFQCKNGDCIKSELLCDGQADCKDSSDETVVECTKAEIICPNYAFRCSYGACVDGDVTCNGIQDCIDNSDETLSRCTGISSNMSSSTSCREDQFTCANGDCINKSSICDGKVDCADNSDETYMQCGSIICPNFSFRCAYGACIDGDLKCNGVKNCADGSDEDPIKCKYTTGTTSTPPPITQRPIPPISSKFCIVPSKPENGYWKLHKSYCCDVQAGQVCNDCDVAQGTRLEPGQELIYKCNPGYKLSKDTRPFCSLQGQWVNIPECKEIRCKGLESASTGVSCRRNGGYTPCSNPLPGTEAILFCRNGYKEQTNFASSRVTCNKNGEWSPNPIQCIPACGLLPVQYIPTIVNGAPANISEFPWHATLYRAENPSAPKRFICGATIIHERLLITAAHCVYDEVAQKLDDASKFYIVTGNIFKDYDSPLHNNITVKKAKVKRIYYHCDRYRGLSGNYENDIAILEVTPPLTLSNRLVPVCLDSKDEIKLENGMYGKVAGFGKTASGEFSAMLQQITVPYVSYSMCKHSSIVPETGQVLITNDKFCAGYVNGSSVCNGDSGGGLIFSSNTLWYLKGIVSVTISKTIGGSTTCNSDTYSLYTQVSNHLLWIQDIILSIDQQSLLPVCPT
ncbi:modular serine protease-like [Bombus pyrosoma]|uniref:modular serine protease-like n=1 Tax=Bombus pyrosoma TaxID=396416 RepID=UPI001CB9536F|nr:modular serine protease-like [Bombus pyrosoma]